MKATRFELTEAELGAAVYSDFTPGGTEEIGVRSAWTGGASQLGKTARIFPLLLPAEHVPFLGVKRTWCGLVGMSANDQSGRWHFKNNILSTLEKLSR